MTERRVVVVPTQTVPQGIAAMLAFDASVSEDTNAANMRAAAENTRTVFVTRAARGASFDGVQIDEGQYLALLENTLIASGGVLSDIISAVAANLKSMSPEFVTIYSGADAPPDEADAVTSAIESEISAAEVTKIYGGQPVYSYVISAE
jgi:dihydroxyacetone kinase-like predicted kinase